MSIIHFDEEKVVVRKWASSSTSGPRGKSIVRVELETRDPYALASILRQLEEIDTDQRRAAAQAKASAKKQPARPLMLPYHGDDL
ncbi:hypothetical protein [Sphingopyxis granuli]|uniref:hypothetical protein n=1 Tax=Sphingopyxis granuli TaxID=267128 RepID=UPI001BAF09AD|nr:hypothetical protein [Sphingopyxis granuli]QUM72218.1 hypothetical protein ICN83_18305 [Sphingopyxis granuli]